MTMTDPESAEILLQPLHAFKLLTRAGTNGLEQDIYGPRYKPHTDAVYRMQLHRGPSAPSAAWHLSSTQPRHGL